MENLREERERERNRVRETGNEKERGSVSEREGWTLENWRGMKRSNERGRKWE